MMENVEYVKETAICIIQPSTFVPFLAIMALSNVINSGIRVFTDRIRDKRLFNMYNCVVNPFGIKKNDSEPLHLFWTSLNSSDKLDHFVPLLGKDVLEQNQALVPSMVNIVEPFDITFMNSMFQQIGGKRKYSIFDHRCKEVEVPIIGNLVPVKKTAQSITPVVKWICRLLDVLKTYLYGKKMNVKDICCIQ